MVCNAPFFAAFLHTSRNAEYRNVVPISKIFIGWINLDNLYLKPTEKMHPTQHSLANFWPFLCSLAMPVKRVLRNVVAQCNFNSWGRLHIVWYFRKTKLSNYQNNFLWAFKLMKINQQIVIKFTPWRKTYALSKERITISLSWMATKLSEIKFA
jgi:hypothetical protein